MNKLLILGQYKKILAVILILVALFLFMVYLSIFRSGGESQIRPDLDKNYSNLNKVIPGQSTKEDVEKINGQPESTRVSGDKVYMYYKTPLGGFTNTVLLEKNIVSYAVESVFGSYRGSFKDISTKYGTSSLTLSQEEEELFPWYVYLDKGIAVETDDRDILKIVYFVPQAASSFMETVAKDLKLTADQDTDHEEPVFPPGI